ncbi:polysaccharide biosynthesis/export family protein [uncultured Flavobacterium sp.]|uniref:polysaccharide biosynthesis/export family protein n=1 Tax=uncultured Flavobacterium sp. TaxID=165435 RepID=UPI0030EF7B62|tara:strand:- start:92476 stop:93264 length:789 start_codon:yes stop_codon:yes gene_type:complete
MRILKFFILFIAATSLFSCIPNKDLIYLQDYGNKPDGITINEFDAKPYRVQVNDILSINIKALDQKLVEMFDAFSQQGQIPSPQTVYFSGYNVNQHGNIRIPVLGEINVLGFTIDEVRVTIEKRLTDEYFTAEARIFVTVKIAGFNYTINGEIGKPGSQVLFQEKVTILEAIANSGDINLTGNRKEVQILRKQPHGFEMYSLDLTDGNIINSPNFYIQPNDYIIVKPLRQKSWGTGTTGVQTIGTIITALSLVTTTILLIRN